MGAFTYSVEEGTRAAAMPDPVPETPGPGAAGASCWTCSAPCSFEKGLDAGGARARPPWWTASCDDDPEYAVQARTQGQAPDVDGVTNLLADEAAAGWRPATWWRWRSWTRWSYDLVGRVVA